MIRKVKTILEEQETHIYMAPLDNDDKLLVYTTEPSMLKKMWELHKLYPDDVTIKNDDKYGSEFLIPPDWCSIKPKKKYTEAEKKELVKRFNKGQKSAGKRSK